MNVNAVVSSPEAISALIAAHAPGIGMILIAAANDAERIVENLNGRGELRYDFEFDGGI